MAANPAVRAGRPLEAGYHLVVSFAPGERPGAAALDDIEDALVRAVGLQEHQRISAAHKDRAHYHLHVVVNLVHPVRFTTADVRFDKRALSAACAAMERRHGLIRANHGELAPALAERLREEAGPALLRAAQAGGG